MEGRGRGRGAGEAWAPGQAEASRPVSMAARKSSAETASGPEHPIIHVCSMCSFVQQTFVKRFLCARRWAGLGGTR